MWRSVAQSPCNKTVGGQRLSGRIPDDRIDRHGVRATGPLADSKPLTAEYGCQSLCASRRVGRDCYVGWNGSGDRLGPGTTSRVCIAPSHSRMSGAESQATYAKPGRKEQRERQLLPLRHRTPDSVVMQTYQTYRCYAATSIFIHTIHHEQQSAAASRRAHGRPSRGMVSYRHSG